ncbi:hypothetical protein D3C80_1871630 [compost metagenome]
MEAQAPLMTQQPLLAGQEQQGTGTGTLSVGIGGEAVFLDTQGNRPGFAQQPAGAVQLDCGQLWIGPEKLLECAQAAG